jgi:hypothetical protein
MHNAGQVFKQAKVKAGKAVGLSAKVSECTLCLELTMCRSWLFAPKN